jgi:hypothetical protein
MFLRDADLRCVRRARARLDAGASGYFMPEVVKIGSLFRLAARGAVGRGTGVPLFNSFPEICTHLLPAVECRH